LTRAREVIESRPRVGWATVAEAVRAAAEFNEGFDRARKSLSALGLAEYRLAVRASPPAARDAFLYGVAAHVARAESGSYADGVERAASLLLRWFLDAGLR
jgi:hypothetical protein